MSLFEQFDDPTEAITHLLLAGLFEDAAQECRPTRIADRKQVGEPQERLFEFLKLLGEFVLAGRERRFIRSS